MSPHVAAVEEDHAQRDAALLHAVEQAEQVKGQRLRGQQVGPEAVEVVSRARFAVGQRPGHDRGDDVGALVTCRGADARVEAAPVR